MVAGSLWPGLGDIVLGFASLFLGVLLLEMTWGLLKDVLELRARRQGKR